MRELERPTKAGSSETSPIITDAEGASNTEEPSSGEIDTGED